MLSTNATSNIQGRRSTHRRQNSTPAAFEAPQVRSLPAHIQHKRQSRSGMSLDLRGLNLDSVGMSGQGSNQDHTNPAVTNLPAFQQEDSTVSITNLGQIPQHTMQVAQPHSQPQPGTQDSFLRSPVQTSLPSPRTPRRSTRAQSPQQPPLSPNKPPTQEQLKALHEHIQSVYGSNGQVFINILPTPTATPQKPTQLPSHEPLDSAPMPPSFSDMADINFEPTSSAMTFDFDNPDNDLGYDSSSYYTSDALSPSPTSSPRQKTVPTFLEGIEENQEMNFSQASLFAPHSASSQLDGHPMQMGSFSQPAVLSELEIDASFEYTGISPEEVQRYISEQDPATTKWTCLYPDCGKVFGRRENIRSHVQTHLGDRQFKCNGCGKCFVRQHDLKRHAKIHTGNKPYKCPCGAGFARQDALTRHRQRGMCVGGFPDAVRRQAKRGRPKKNRPDMEHRVEKAKKTRRAIASAASSIDADSPRSPASSPPPFEEYQSPEAHGLTQLSSEPSSFSNPVNSSIDPFSYKPASSPFAEANHTGGSNFASSSSFTGETASLNLLQQLSQHTHTPPMSPADHQSRPHSSGSSYAGNLPLQPSPLKDSFTPSHSSNQSNQFTTPPTSPVEPEGEQVEPSSDFVQPKDDLNELFNTQMDGSCSQFDLEMKAMGDFTSFDTSYDFLDFSQA